MEGEEAKDYKKSIPADLIDHVLGASQKLDPKTHQICSGIDFNSPDFSFEKLFEAYRHFGFQATNLGLAIEEIEKMIKWRLSDEVPNPQKQSDEKLDPQFRKKQRCTIFLAYTSNMASCGVREVIRYLAQHKMVSCIVTTAGGIEEDLMKCSAPTFMGDFTLKGTELRKKGLNRIGNLIVPNYNYELFEEWLHPILTEMRREQNEEGKEWTPSSFIHRLGKEINNEESIYYWCWKNNIPVFSPAVTDGSIGDILYLHTWKHPEKPLKLDIVMDIRGINEMARKAPKSGIIIIGGGLVKHHVCNANLMKNGADFSVFINTAQQFDGSDSGARPDEAVSWGKIAMTAKPVKVYAEASLVVPIIVAQTFKKHFDLACRVEK